MDEKKINYYRILSAFFLILALVIIYSVFWGPAKRFSDSFLPAKTVTINAEGKVIVSPDIAKISFSVISRGADPGEVADKNNKKMNEAIDFIKSQGIDPKDIKTTQYNLTPIYVYNEKEGRNYISGYELTQTVLVKIRDFRKIGKILGALPEYGINQIGQVSFDVDEPEKYLAEARSQAFDKVKSKAEEMAKKNNAKLGSVINFSEYQGPQPIPYYESYAKGMGGGGPVAAPSIQPGSQEVSVQVSVTYEIK